MTTGSNALAKLNATGLAVEKMTDQDLEEVRMLELAFALTDLLCIQELDREFAVTHNVISEVAIENHLGAGSESALRKVGGRRSEYAVAQIQGVAILALGDHRLAPAQPRLLAQEVDGVPQSDPQRVVHRRIEAQQLA